MPHSETSVRHFEAIQKKWDKNRRSFNLVHHVYKMIVVLVGLLWEMESALN